MTSRALLPQDANYLAKLLGMLGSDHAGEVAVAGRKANAFVRRLGLTWRDVIYCPPDSWLQMAAACAKYPEFLSERELHFVRDMTRCQRLPTDRQARWLESIFLRVYRRAA